MRANGHKSVMNGNGHNRRIGTPPELPVPNAFGRHAIAVMNAIELAFEHWRSFAFLVSDEGDDACLDEGDLRETVEAFQRLRTSASQAAVNALLRNEFTDKHYESRRQHLMQFVEYAPVEHLAPVTAMKLEYVLAAAGRPSIEPDEPEDAEEQ